MVPTKLHLEESSLIVGAKDFPVTRLVPKCNQIDNACLLMLIKSQKVYVLGGVDDKANIMDQLVSIRFKDDYFTFFTKLNDLCVSCAQ